MRHPDPSPGLRRRLVRFLRPPGYVPLGNPQSQAHYARWRHWYAAGGLGLLVVGMVLVLAGSLFLGPWVLSLALMSGLFALGGWRVTHPPAPREPE
jgi:hypothetical protein